MKRWLLIQNNKNLNLPLKHDLNSISMLYIKAIYIYLEVMVYCDCHFQILQGNALLQISSHKALRISTSFRFSNWKWLFDGNEF